MNSTFFKVGVGTAAVLVAACLLLQSSARKYPPATLSPTMPALLSADVASVPAVSPALLNSTTANVASPAIAQSKLSLQIDSADTGEPLPGVEIDFRGSEGATVAKKSLLTATDGVCVVEFAGATTKLDLTTRHDGYADTRLLWQTDRGENIPATYTVHLARAVRIGGSVVDPEGRPVSGARVVLNHLAPAHTIESHDFGRIETLTDADGRWTVNRIAPEMLTSLLGLASHPDYVAAPLPHSNPTTELEKKLREGTHVLRLGPALKVTGLVVNPDGQPIPGATVRVGYLEEAERRQTSATADGAFVIGGCKPGATLITAEAEGFAPATVALAIASNSPLVRLVLNHGNVLKIRVVNVSGQPIPGASVQLNAFGRGRSPGAMPPLQAEFSAQTDADGRLEWAHAPDQELWFAVAASGFMRANAAHVVPSGREETVVLSPALTIYGKVLDAVTHAPITHFHITPGLPGSTLKTKTVSDNWSTLSSSLSFTGETYRHTFDEPAGTAPGNPGYIFRFEADGYVPFTSRVVGPDEGEVRMDAALQPAPGITVTALLPNGRPAAGADVGLASYSGRLQLVPGGFSRANHPSPDSLLTSDPSGTFRVPADDSIQRVIVATAEGYGEKTPAALRSDPFIRLQPWGRLEGECPTNRPVGIPSGNPCQVWLNTLYGDLVFDPAAFTATVDPLGRFVLPQVPPGKLKLHRVHAPRDDHATVADVEILPGQTTTVDFNQLPR